MPPAPQLPLLPLLLLLLLLLASECSPAAAPASVREAVRRPGREGRGLFDGALTRVLGSLMGAALRHSAPAGPAASAGASPAAGLLSAFLRLLGLRSNSLAAVAVNGLIFLAQLIGSTFVENGAGSGGSGSATGWGPQAYRQQEYGEEGEGEEEDPDLLQWLLVRPGAKGRALLSEARTPGLAARAAAEVPSPGGAGSCVRLLLCSLSPVVLAMQRALEPAVAAAAGTTPGPVPTPTARSDPLALMPRAADLASAADACEIEYPDCRPLRA